MELHENIMTMLTLWSIIIIVITNALQILYLIEVSQAMGIWKFSPQLVISKQNFTTNEYTLVCVNIFPYLFTKLPLCVLRAIYCHWKMIAPSIQKLVFLSIIGPVPGGVFFNTSFHYQLTSYLASMSYGSYLIKVQFFGISIN